MSVCRFSYYSEYVKLGIPRQSGLTCIRVYQKTDRSLVDAVGVFRQEKLVVLARWRAQSKVHHLRMSDVPLRIIRVSAFLQLLHPFEFRIHLQLQHCLNIIEPYIYWPLIAFLAHVF